MFRGKKTKVRYLYGKNLADADMKKHSGEGATPLLFFCPDDVTGG
jgi:hypothetical protein